MKTKDYYKILGIPRAAADDEIKSAYRKLASKLHPDLHPGDKSKEARFKEINEAYAVLSDPGRRRTYDLGGSVSFEGGMPQGGGVGGQGGFGGFDFKDFGANMGGVEGIFSEIFGRGASRRPTAPPRAQFRGGDIEHSLQIDFLHAIKGAEVRVTVKRGKGTEKLTVKVPPGVTDGARVKVAGKGKPSQVGGPPGDLFIITSVKPHPYFTRKGSDLYVEVPVTISEAVLGATIDVPTIDGIATIKVPPATASGQKLRIKGKGLAGGAGASRKSGRGGDLYAVISIALPKKIGKKERELLEEFDLINPYEPRRGLW